MPEPEFDPLLFSLQIQEQEGERFKKQVQRDARERRQQPYSAYLGHDQETGKALIRPLGGTGVVETQSLSNSQSAVGQSVRGFGNGAKSQNIRHPEDEIFAEPQGEVAVLARKKKPDGTYQLWLGGIVRSPILVADNISLQPVATLELIGSGKRDWIVSIKYGIKETSTIAVKYGKQDQDNQRQDWSITSPVCDYLRYYGMGFWATNGAIAYRWGSWLTTETAPFPDNVLPPAGLGTYYRENCHDVGAYNVNYCEITRFEGARSATQVGYDLREGFDPSAGFGNNFPYQYTGSNLNQTQRTVSAVWEGDVEGPGYLGPASEFCTLGSAPIVGTLQLPNKLQNSVEFTEINLDTQSYSFNAYRGAIQVSVGFHQMAQRIDSLYIRPSGGLKLTGYKGECREYTSPSEFRWTIQGDGRGEAWPDIPQSTTGTNTGLSASYSNQLKIAPSIQKTFQFSGVNLTSSVSSNASVQYIYPTANIFAGNGVSYYKLTQSGQATISAAYGSLPHFFNSNPTLKNYLIYKGQELELLDGFNTYWTLWKDEASSIYPVGYEVKYPPYKRLPNNNLDIDSLNIFKRDINFIINKYIGRLQNNKVIFDGNQENKTRKALSLKTLGDIDVTVADIKYWSKSIST